MNLVDNDFIEPEEKIKVIAKGILDAMESQTTSDVRYVRDIIQILDICARQWFKKLGWIPSSGGYMPPEDYENGCR